MKRSTLIEVVAWVVCLAGMIAVARVAHGQDGPWSVQISTYDLGETDYYVQFKGRSWFFSCGYWNHDACDDFVWMMNEADNQRNRRGTTTDMMPEQIPSGPTLDERPYKIRVTTEPFHDMTPCQTGDQGCEDKGEK